MTELNQTLLDEVLKSPRLPSLPTIALEVIDLVQQKNVDIKQIANTIKHDPALASKILKTVNSSFYGQAYAVSTISHALVVLGLNSVKTLALGFSLVNNLADQGGDGFDHMEFWKRSLFTATASKTLAMRCGVVQQEEAFLGGLLQDLGMLTMNQTLGNQYNKLIARSNGNHANLHNLEAEELNLTHPIVGEKLASSWSLPPLLTQAILHHHDPDQAPLDMQKLIRCVALGNHVADVYMLPEDQAGGALEKYNRLASEWCGLSEEEAEPVLREIHAQTKEMQRLFDLPCGGLGNPDEILGAAQEAMVNVTMQAAQQTVQLEEKNKTLANEAYTDALTGVANRRAFDKFVAEQFDLANEADPISVLFMDVDHFKKFNDTHGHAIGDKVLVCFGETLETAVGDQGKVFRYGGEEFAIVCPGVDRRTAAQLAEKVRKAVETEAKVTNETGEVLGIAASIGVACHTGDTFPNADILVKAADQGVYAAKKGGRNCVRIFAPRKKTAA